MTWNRRLPTSTKRSPYMLKLSQPFAINIPSTQQTKLNRTITTANSTDLPTQKERKSLADKLCNHPNHSILKLKHLSKQHTQSLTNDYSAELAREAQTKSVIEKGNGESKVRCNSGVKKQHQYPSNVADHSREKTPPLPSKWERSISKTTKLPLEYDYKDEPLGYW